MTARKRPESPDCPVLGSCTAGPDQSSRTRRRRHGRKWQGRTLGEDVWAGSDSESGPDCRNRDIRHSREGRRPAGIDRWSTSRRRARGALYNGCLTLMTMLNELSVFEHAVAIFREQGKECPNLLRATRDLAAVGTPVDRRTLRVWWHSGRVLGRGRRTPSIKDLIASTASPVAARAPVELRREPEPAAEPVTATPAAEPTPVPATEPAQPPTPARAPEHVQAVEPPDVAAEAPVASAAPPAPRPEPALATAVAESPEAKLAKLRAGAVDAVVKEGKVIAQGRDLANGLLATGTAILLGMHPAAVRLAERLKREETDVDVTLRRLTSIAKMLNEAAASAERFMSAQRLLVGAPGVITEHRSTQAPPAPPEDPSVTVERMRVLAAALAEADKTLTVEGRVIETKEEERAEGSA